jgi:hypothetical protein
MPILAESGERVDVMKKLHDDKCVNPGANVVHHDPGTGGKSFHLADRGRLKNVE